VGRRCGPGIGQFHDAKHGTKEERRNEKRGWSETV